MELVINTALMTLLAVVTVAIIRQRSLFSVVILSGIYSFLMASLLIILDAVDVAMTEASVGAGVSTVVLLATLHLVKTREMRPVRPRPLALLVTIGTGALLIWGTLVLPPFGTADAVIHTHVVPRYLADTIGRNRRSQCRDLRARGLSRLRHAGRDHGDFHSRYRGHAAVAWVASAGPRGPRLRRRLPMSLDLIIRVGIKLVLPFILLFALYVQFHGDFGPGGDSRRVSSLPRQ